MPSANKKKPAKSARAKSAAKKPGIDLSKLKVAIVCDWLTGTGGAERVVLELHRLFPDAPIYTSQYDRNPRIWYGGTWFGDADIRTSWLQRLPKGLRKFLPVLRARMFSKLDLSEYDLVLVSSGAEAKAVKTGPGTTVVWYCHAPTHYYWSRYNDYMKHPGFGILNPFARLGLWILVKPLRRWDRGAAQRPDLVLANSTHTKSEIKKYYGRTAKVVYPPVDTKRFADAASHAKSTQKKGNGRGRYGFVVAGRQTPYKRIDLAVEACSNLKLPLTVIGNGPDHAKLTQMAGPSIRFLTNVSDKAIAHHFNLARAFIFPGVDDFGIVAVEALSAGTPVIAYKAGGALDYVKDGVTGKLFEEQTPESLMEQLKSFDADSFESARIIRQSQLYSVNHFRSSITRAIQSHLQKLTAP